MSEFIPTTDLYASQGDPTASRKRNRRQNTFTTSGKWPVLNFRLELHDFIDGVNQAEGYFDEQGNSYVYNGGAITHEDGELYLATAASTLASIAITGDIVGLHSLNIFGNMAMAAGSGANVSLFKETSATDPTQVVVTYSPGSSITGLYPVIVGGVTSALRMAVTKVGGVIDIHSAIGTSATTMHASTNPGWGLIQTSLPGGPILVYAGNSIFNNLNAASAAGDAVTASEITNAPAGGFALGEDGLEGVPRSAYWVWPQQNNTAGMLKFGAETYGRVMRTNLIGTDATEVSFTYLPRGVKGAVLCRHNIFAFDDGTISRYRGPHFPEENLEIFRRRVTVSSSPNFVPQSTLRHYVRGLKVKGPDLYADVELVDTTGASGSTVWEEKYDFNAKVWHVISATLVTGAVSASPSTVLPGGSGPVSGQTNNIHLLSENAGTDTFANIFTAPAGEDAFWSRQGTTTGEVRNTSALLVSSRFIFRGYEGLPMKLDQVYFAGNLGPGGAASSVGLSITEVSPSGSLETIYNQTFRYGDRRDTMRNKVTAVWYAPQFAITVTRGSDTRRTPMGVPWVLSGRIFLDGTVRP